MRAKVLALVSFACFIVCNIAARAATDTWDGLGTDNLWKTSANWVGSSSPNPGDVLVFDGTNRPSSVNNFGSGTQFNGIVFNSTAAANFTLAGATINLNGNIAENAQAFLDTISLNLSLQTTPTISVASTGTLVLSGIVSGNFGFNETGSGLLTLSGPNTFQGPISIGNGATLGISADSNLGTAPGSPTAADIVLNGGATLATTGTSNITINSTRGMRILNTGGPNSGIVNVNGGQTVNYYGVIDDNGTVGGLEKLSFGTLALGNTETYTGPTTIGNGTLNLDFTQTSSPTNNVIQPTSSLTMGGFNAGFAQNSYSQLIITGKGSASNTQTFAGTNINIGPALVNVISGTSAGSAATLDLGSLTHTSGGTALFIMTSTTSTTATIKTSATNTNGIIGGWTTVFNGLNFSSGATTIPEGSTFATVVGGQIAQYAGYTDFAATIGTDTGGTIPNGPIHGAVTSATNFKINPTANSFVSIDNDNANSVTQMNTLSFQGTSSAPTLSIGKGNTLDLGQYGSIFKQDNIPPVGTLEVSLRVVAKRAMVPTHRKTLGRLRLAP